MKKQQFGRTGLMISPVVYGAIIHMNETPGTTKAYIAEAIDRGVNYFDVAPSYGNAQALMGPAIEPYRNDIVLACKTTERTAEGSRKELLGSLEALHTDHFDIYQIHSLTTMAEVDTIFGPGGAMETFLWAREQGLVRYIGMSVHNEKAALKAMELFDFDSILFPMNWALGLTTGWGDAIAEKAAESNKGLLAMKTLAHRTWREGEAKRYPKSWCRPLDTEGDDVAIALAAMKYGFSKGAHTLIPPGDIDHYRFMLDHIDEVLENPLTAEDLALLTREAELVKDETIFKPAQMS